MMEGMGMGMGWACQLSQGRDLCACGVVWCGVVCVCVGKKTKMGKWEGEGCLSVCQGSVRVICSGKASRLRGEKHKCIRGEESRAKEGYTGMLI